MFDFLTIRLFDLLVDFDFDLSEISEFYDHVKWFLIGLGFLLEFGFMNLWILQTSSKITGSWDLCLIKFSKWIYYSPLVSNFI